MKADQYLGKLKARRNNLDWSLIERAFVWAQKAHAGQKRKSGENYLSHPIAVSLILADLQLDGESIAAGLLHDTIEDSNLTPEDLAKDFPKSLVALIDGVTTLGKVDFDQYWQNKIGEKDQEIESLRKLFLAIAADTRVVFIKLADRLHNMRTLCYLEKTDQIRIAKETLDVFAPLADRMGMGQIKAELEDLSFRYYLADEYQRVEALMLPKIKEGQLQLPKIRKFLNKILSQEKIKYRIDGRTKHLYSTYKKLQKYDGDIDKIYDVVAVRIIVGSISDCYRVLGIIHSHFRPLIGKIKDYIAVPKPNGYRSLHTTVFGVDGKITEIQIRTEEMHEEAENGLAAHWKYADKKSAVYTKGKVAETDDRERKVIAELRETINQEGFGANTAIDLFPDKIFVFSPKGDIYELRDGSTPIDFAYAIHSTIAEKCIGCKVNGKISPLDCHLGNCDIVEIITSKKASGPSRDWLFFVVTAKAKQKIRNYLKQQDRNKNIVTGSEILEEELKFFSRNLESVSRTDWKKIFDSYPQNSVEGILASIGEGMISGTQIAKKICSRKKVRIVRPRKRARSSAVEIEGGTGVKFFFSPCCHPGTNDRIIGFITKGRGISIHREDCLNLEQEAMERLVEVKWENDTSRIVKFIITATDRRGLLGDITRILDGLDINIKEVKADKRKDKSRISFSAGLDSGYKRRMLKIRLQEVEGVERVETSV